MGGVLVEHDNRIHALERQEDFGALAFGIERTSGFFDGPYRPIGVDADDKQSSEPSRVLEIPDMAGMEEVEHAVGEYDTTTFRLG
jgi:hypothetical protein